MTTRMRVAGWRIQPVIFADDGENLDEKQVNPLFLRAAEFEAWAAGGWRDSLAELRAAVEGPAAGLLEDPAPDR